MPNPPSAGAAKGLPPGAPQQKMGNQLLMMMVMFVGIMILFTGELRLILGNAVGIVFEPAIGFGGSYPLMTLLLAGMLMIFTSTILRHFFVDWVEMARNQRIVSAFNKELRKARMDNNTYKIKKLTEMQGEIMSKSFSSMQTQMKLMPITMIVIIPIFAWLYIFVSDVIPTATFSVPWADYANLEDFTVLPNWILVYSLLTIPFGQVLARTLKYFSFRKKLAEMESGGLAPHESIN